MNIKPLFISVCTLFASYNQIAAQVLTPEDSLAKGLSANGNKNTVISGYGEAAYRNDLNAKSASINLARGVIFLGHKFNSRISFFSEIEIEDAKVAGGESGGEIAFEQAFLKFGLSKSVYITAGLFIPRVGIINENHLPTTFNSVFRPRLETKLIPATWRELGIGLYGSTASIPGLNYSIAVVNGLNGKEFGVEGLGIREGRYEGRDASANNLAVTGALLYYIGDFRIQASTYYGGTYGQKDSIGDANGLKSGAFGTPVILTEADIQYHKKGFYLTLLGSMINVTDAEKLNASYGNGIANQLGGYYAEAGYNLLENTKYNEKKLILFSRYESFDMNAKVPSNLEKDPTLKQSYLFVGASYLPTHGVIIKADYEVMNTGTPASAPSDFKSSNGFVNLGVGYSF